MGRERPGAFNAQDTGRLGFRYEHEAPDDRPCVIYTEPFWADETERMTYMDAVEANPRRPDEGPFSYIRRLSAVVTGRYEALGQPMPRVRMSRAQRDKQLAKLRGQAKPDLPSGVEDWA